MSMKLLQCVTSIYRLHILRYIAGSPIRRHFCLNKCMYIQNFCRLVFYRYFHYLAEPKITYFWQFLLEKATNEAEKLMGRIGDPD